MSRTMEFVYSDYCPYWIKWYKLDGKVRWVYYQLKAEGYDNVAAELKRQLEAFWNRIEEESNGEDFRNARNAAAKVLRKWENENDCAG
ncbi:uncharacterized protein TM35_000671150, partial [Trypanosoma theileri]